MRQDDRVTSVTFTLPADHKWTTVEAALVEAHDREYELRMAFFWECERLKAEVERLTKAGDWVMSHWSSGDGSDEVRFCQALLKWKNAKEGKQP
jgi:hypothetical protein